MHTLNEWLEHIESLHPAHIELGLARIQTVAHRLNVSSFDCPVVVVTGTNGKGSAIATLEALSVHAKCRCAAYTSPHLLRFNERLRINQEALEDDVWVQAFQQVDQAREGIELTYFEFTTLAALVLIKQNPIDVMFLEVGLGGRLDAVNLVDHDYSMITSIDFDHEDWLGDTLEKIAFEKAGIVRMNSYLAVGNSNVSGLVAPHLPAGVQVEDAEHLSQLPGCWSQENEEIIANEIYSDSFRAALLTAARIQHDHGLPLLPNTQQSLREALNKRSVSGRWQLLPHHSQVWVDVAHNPQAIANLVNKMQATSVEHWWVVCGMLKDKRAMNALQHLRSIVDHWTLVPTQGPRGQTSHALKAQLIDDSPTQLTDDRTEMTSDRQRTVKAALDSTTENGSHTEHSESFRDVVCFNSEPEALQHCLQHRQKNDGILVFGSFLTVANVFE